MDTNGIQRRDLKLQVEGKRRQDKPDWDGLPKQSTVIKHRKSTNEEWGQKSAG
jgi:hypothetical protein